MSCVLLALIRKQQLVFEGEEGKARESSRDAESLNPLLCCCDFTISAHLKSGSFELERCDETNGSEPPGTEELLFLAAVDVKESRVSDRTTETDRGWNVKAAAWKNTSSSSQLRFPGEARLQTKKKNLRLLRLLSGPDRTCRSSHVTQI